MNAARGGEPEHALARWIFLRALAAVYLIAFLSLWSQILGLSGSHGIRPAADFLSQVRDQLGHPAWRRVPTLFWFGASDGMLRAACLAGAALSALLLAGLASAPVLVLLWALYLSLTVVGGPFLSFQWDTLLLEAGLTAILVAPWTWWSAPGRLREPARFTVWLPRLLLFKLMVLSGLVKITSGDPNWLHLDALAYHYWTQPLPTWIGWWAAHLPAWFGRLSVAFLFAVELGAPFLMFLGRRGRLASFGLLVLLQLLIAATGNYGFFNLLAIVLCLSLLDDGHWRSLLPRARNRAPAGRRPGDGFGPRAVTAVLGTALLALSALSFAAEVGGYRGLPGPSMAVLEAVQPFRSVNGYGLFRVMTTSRLEIQVEGSDDGADWKPYRFRYKPGDPDQRPGLVAPYMPRLDWQMWFAALGTWRQNPWFVNLMARLLTGSPPVLDLLAGNPFPDRPPRYVRATLWNYRFAGLGLHRRTGAWWTREPRGLYLPRISLRDLGLPPEGTPAGPRNPPHGT